MTNRNIAQIFFDIADIIELTKPDDKFRFIAYRNAAQKIAHWPESLTDIYADKGVAGLDEISGVGEAIAQKIAEIISTGRLKYYEELKKTVPGPELEFAQIPSVGPKNAVKLYQLTKAKSVKELASILRQKIELGPFKRKSINNILRGIDIMKKTDRRWLLDDVVPLANKVVNYLNQLPEVHQADYVGSLRRMKETIGDVDIIAASNDPKSTIEQYVKYISGTIMAKGDTKATIINEDNIQIDLEILPEAEYGSLLQHFTGSKEHNVAFRTYLQSVGLSFSEHGIKKLKSGRWPIPTPDVSRQERKKLDRAKAGDIIQCHTEEMVYHYAGMAWLPPEMREDRGEITLALKHRLPKIVTIDDIKGDFHLHSQSSDGENTVDEYAAEAKKYNYDYLAITDHSPGLAVAHGQSPEQVVKQMNDIVRWNQSHRGVTVLHGIEVNINSDGSLDMDDDVLRRLNVVIASIHSGFNQDGETITKRYLKAIESGRVDIIGHPTGRRLGIREPFNADWDVIYKACAKFNVALEIDASPDRLDLPDYMVMEAKRHNVIFAISTDSHEMSQFGKMSYGVAVARRAWLEPKQILNTLTLASLKKWLAR